MAIVGLMGVTSKSVRLPVQKVQHGLAVATDLWFWTGCSGNALYPVPGRYSGPNKFKRRVAHPWSWDIGSSTRAAQMSLNMVRSRLKARPFGLSTKLGLQENGRPSPKGTTLWPGPYSMD